MCHWSWHCRVWCSCSHQWRAIWWQSPKSSGIFTASCLIWAHWIGLHIIGFWLINCWMVIASDGGNDARHQHQQANHERPNNQVPNPIPCVSIAALQLEEAQGAKKWPDALRLWKDSAWIITAFQRASCIVVQTQNWHQRSRTTNAQSFCSNGRWIGMATDRSEDNRATGNEVLQPQHSAWNVSQSPNTLSLEDPFCTAAVDVNEHPSLPACQPWKQTAQEDSIGGSTAASVTFAELRLTTFWVRVEAAWPDENQAWTHRLSGIAGPATVCDDFQHIVWFSNIRIPMANATAPASPLQRNWNLTMTCKIRHQMSKLCHAFLGGFGAVSGNMSDDILACVANHLPDISVSQRMFEKL